MKSRARSGEDGALNHLATQLADLAGPFTTWISQTGWVPHPPAQLDVGFRELERPLLVGLGLMQRLNSANPLGWRPIQLAEALDKLTSEPGDRSVVGALLLYTRFLADTGRWLADQADLSFSLRLLEAELVATEAPNRIVAAHEEIAELAELPAVEEVRTLARWVGGGKRLTATGALRLADVVEVSELLGEPVATSAATASSDEPVVRSMWQAPALSLAWVTAHRAGLLDDVGGRVVVTAAGADLASDDDELRRQALRQTVSGYVLTLLEAVPANAEEADDTVVRLVVMAAARAITGSPISPAGLREAATATADHDVLDELDDELSIWAAAGLLDVGETIDVQPGVRPAIAAGLLAWGVDPDELPLPTQA